MTTDLPMKPTAPGPTYWQTLEQLADAPDVRGQIDADVEQEFANYDPAAVISPGGVSRRRFMKLMGASMALAGVGLTGCRRWPKEIIAPYAYRPQGMIPSLPEYFATVMELGGVARPLLAKSFDGRPIKLEGNPTHPYARTANPDLGAADLYAQASVLALYDPERSRAPARRDGDAIKAGTWDAFAEAFARHEAAAGSAGGGKGSMAVLSRAHSGPTFAAVKKAFSAKFPSAAFYEYEPITRANEAAGAKLAFGKPVRTVLHLENAEVLACFDGDPIGLHPAQLKYRADWISTRKSADEGKMSRLYAAESTFTQTGTMADYRLPVRASRLPAMLVALAGELGMGGSGGEMSGAEKQFVAGVAADLKAHKGRAVVVVGENLPAEAVALGHRINGAFGTVGPKGTHHYIADPAGEGPTSVEQIKTLTAAMAGGSVKTLLVLGGNPVYDAPADLRFEAALQKVPFAAHLSDYYDETSAACAWHLNAAHYLESWGDARAWDGTLSVVQPLILPIFDGRTPAELLALLSGDPLAVLDPVEAPATTRPATMPVEGKVTLGGGFAGLAGLVRRTFREGDLLDVKNGDFEKAFRRVLNLGLVPGSAAKPIDVTAKAVEMNLPAAPKAGTYEVRFVQDACLYDGRYANNGWLQEVPDPVTKLVWDNAALMSKVDADALGVRMADKAGCDQISINVNGRNLTLPVYILAGQPAGSIAVSLGYGRRRAGHIGGTAKDPVGFDAYQLRTAGAMETAAGATVAKAAGTHQLVMTQQHQLLGYGDEVAKYGLEERLGTRGHNGKTVREASLAEYVADPKIAHRGVEGGVTLQLFNGPNGYDEPHAWGMAIDMTACTGCNQCVAACQAENNIPVVGKSAVYMKREMAWLRIDRYFKGPFDAPDVVHMPMMCQHCENAPCEQVCPVAATVHDTEGLNVMVYNRCIGTRYCGNNCPYKVRRFNYMDWQSRDPRGSPYNSLWPGIPDQQQEAQVDVLKRMVFNPDVTVRMRGVMEKCTYCVQRIHGATINAKNEWAQGVRPKVKADGKTPGYIVNDGEIATACQQACPTQAITFGNLNDRGAKVTNLQKNPRAYGVLADLNTRPRTKYLALIRNREAEAGGEGGGEKAEA